MQRSPLLVATEFVDDDSIPIDCLCGTDVFRAWLDWSGLLWGAGIGMGWWLAISGFFAGTMRRCTDCIDAVGGG
jgi:hypothetical protein